MPPGATRGPFPPGSGWNSEDHKVGFAFPSRLRPIPPSLLQDTKVCASLNSGVSRFKTHQIFTYVHAAGGSRWTRVGCVC